MRKKIGMIGGTGPQGQGLSIRWALAGESVIMGSRSQEKANEIANKINQMIGKDLVIPMTNEACVQEADIILLTVPFEYAIDTIKPLVTFLNSDNVLVDVTVPLKPFVKGKMIDVIPELEDGALSATEALFKVIPEDIPIIGAFKTLSNSTLNAIERIPVLTQDVFIFGKDKEAKHEIKSKTSLIKNLRPVDAGGMLAGRHIERFTAFLIGLNIRYKSHDCGMTITGLKEKEW